MVVSLLEAGILPTFGTVVHPLKVRNAQNNASFPRESRIPRFFHELLELTPRDFEATDGKRVADCDLMPRDFGPGEREISRRAHLEISAWDDHHFWATGAIPEVGSGRLCICMYRYNYCGKTKYERLPIQ